MPRGPAIRRGTRASLREQPEFDRRRRDQGRVGATRPTGLPNTRSRHLAAANGSTDCGQRCTPTSRSAFDRVQVAPGDLVQTCQGQGRLDAAVRQRLSGHDVYDARSAQRGGLMNASTAHRGGKKTVSAMREREHGWIQPLNSLRRAALREHLLNLDANDRQGRFPTEPRTPASARRATRSTSPATSSSARSGTIELIGVAHAAVYLSPLSPASRPRTTRPPESDFMNIMERFASSMATRAKGPARSFGIWMLYVVSLHRAVRSEVELEAAERDFARAQARRTATSASATR